MEVTKPNLQSYCPSHHIRLPQASSDGVAKAHKLAMDRIAGVKILSVGLLMTNRFRASVRDYGPRVEIPSQVVQMLSSRSAQHIR